MSRTFWIEPCTVGPSYTASHIHTHAQHWFNSNYNTNNENYIVVWLCILKTNMINHLYFVVCMPRCVERIIICKTLFNWDPHFLFFKKIPFNNRYSVTQWYRQHLYLWVTLTSSLYSKGPWLMQLTIYCEGLNSSTWSNISMYDYCRWLKLVTRATSNVGKQTLERQDFVFQLQLLWKCWTKTEPSLAPLLVTHYLR